ncbi:MAG: L,D-transpeptidase [Hyphomicrobiaceae bacterium]|nr:L,D-transpeptidase [Hyphomicrobiaceae bacterium]
MVANQFSRRALICGGAAAAALPLIIGWTKSRELPFGSDVRTMKPGDFTWAPDRAAPGPVVIIVSTPEQRAYVYREGGLIAVATCSTGRKGHRTPTGVFVILQKDRDHVSSTYRGAKMPFMERLTWSGIALHAGNLPGYPASHGCVRLPFDFAKRLFTITHLGVAVIIADAHSEPSEVVHPSLFLPARAAHEARALAAKTKAKKLPPVARHAAPHRPAKVIISIADRKMRLFEDGHLRAVGPIYVSGEAPIGEHVFVLRAAHQDGHALVWSAVQYGGAARDKARARNPAHVIQRITTNETTAHALHQLMHPGLVMVITDAAAPEKTRSSRNFILMTHHAPDGWNTTVTAQ